MFDIQHHKKSWEYHADRLPFSCACLAAASCLVLMSVNALSERALGILSREERMNIINQQSKKFPSVWIFCSEQVIKWGLK